VFRRRRSADDEPEGELDDTAVDEVGEETAAAPPASTRTTGPWDDSDAPDDDVPRIDLGALLVPVREGMEVRVDVQEQTVVAATLVDGHSAMQIHAFAAPKSSGIWLEVRDEIAESIRQNGGTTENVDGDLGPELRARVPAEAGYPFSAGTSRPVGITVLPRR
jgi:hypothetical protein